MYFDPRGGWGQVARVLSSCTGQTLFLSCSFQAWFCSSTRSFDLQCSAAVQPKERKIKPKRKPKGSKKEPKGSQISLGAASGNLGTLLGESWGRLGRLLASLGSILGALGPLLCDLEAKKALKMNGKGSKIKRKWRQTGDGKATW